MQNVTNMSCMFSNSKNFQSIDLSSFNTKNVTNMSYMFHNCNKLGSIVINKKASNITELTEEVEIIYA